MVEAPGSHAPWRCKPVLEAVLTEVLLAIVAQAQPTPGGQPPVGVLGSPVFMMVLMFLVIYFMMIRPQQKRQQEQKTFLEALKRGDKVITTGGIYGSIYGLKDQIVILEVAKDVRIRIARSQVSRSQAPPASADAEKGGKR